MKPRTDRQGVATYLVGWRGYFGFCQTPSVLSALDQWIRRRLRAIAWKQWKRGRTRFAELRRRGVGRDLAAQTAGSPHGPWRRALRLTLPCKLSSSGDSAWLPSRPRDPHNPPNRRIRTPTYSGVGGATPRGVPFPDLALRTCAYFLATAARRNVRLLGSVRIVCTNCVG
ncbi:group II intron maturase-specific domain-containing protein [Bradyrhizobium sp. 187]|uniref:group II intron maturase-specific domain-containing protein n=1 Tax=Bradyrhizobium sp. 187 TaxID=2782655 RepID=UPI001FFEF22F|nr:group II intron maturase-specific domain-containing protein [Bradyrhizobium sp. 187]